MHDADDKDGSDQRDPRNPRDPRNIGNSHSSGNPRNPRDPRNPENLHARRLQNHPLCTLPIFYDRQTFLHTTEQPATATAATATAPTPITETLQKNPYGKLILHNAQAAQTRLAALCSPSEAFMQHLAAHPLSGKHVRIAERHMSHFASYIANGISPFLGLPKDPDLKLAFPTLASEMYRAMEGHETSLRSLIVAKTPPEISNQLRILLEPLAAQLLILECLNEMQIHPSLPAATLIFNMMQNRAARNLSSTSRPSFDEMAYAVITFAMLEELDRMQHPMADNKEARKARAETHGRLNSAISAMTNSADSAFRHSLQTIHDAIDAHPYFGDAPTVAPPSDSQGFDGLGHF